MHQNKRKREGEEVTPMVCHCSHRAIESLVPFKKNWTSSGSNSPCTKLYATRPPSSLAQVLILPKAGRGLSLNLKVGCQPSSGCDEDATSVLTRAAGWGSPAGSRNVIPPDARGGVLVGAPLGILGG